MRPYLRKHHKWFNQPRESLILALALLLVVGAFIMDVFFFPEAILPGPPFFLSILVAAYFLSPRTTAGVAVFATVLKLADDLIQGTPVWLLTLYFIALVLVGFAGTALASKIRREAMLADERERYLARQDELLRVSTKILGQTTLEGLLQATADGARVLTGARIAITGHGYVSGSFRVGASSRAPGAITCPPGDQFKVERGGVYLELIEKLESIRLTDEEMRSHPAWRGLPPDHGPLRGLLGARLVGRDGRANGLLMVTDKEQGEFTPEDETLLRQLAALASLGLQHIEARWDAEHHAAELDVSNKELQGFAYSVAHDLRAPLRHVNSFAQIVQEEYGDRLDERGKEYLGFLSSASQKMGQLIDDLLQLSRVTRAEMLRQPVNLSEIAQSVAVELRKKEPDRKVEFAIIPGAVANGDLQLLRAVLENLIENAWKFTSTRALASIEFGVTQQNGTPVFFVKDNGVGFDMAYVEKLFGAFQRLHRAEEFPGTGIGLAIVQRIIQRHGGSVWAEGAVDEGATFYFALE
ncbi:MAG: GAF domain-containing protein [Chloroflexi bacterium]|nr:GAF domain-containing protein [Chloroflexota bacterium]